VQEVEEDKKNAAKLNALVKMVPSTDWPERKEPPEFSNLPKTNKSKPAKEHHEYPQHFASGEGRKIHTFAQVYKKNLENLNLVTIREEKERREGEKKRGRLRGEI